MIDIHLPVDGLTQPLPRTLDQNKAWQLILKVVCDHPELCDWLGRGGVNATYGCFFCNCKMADIGCFHLGGNSHHPSTYTHFTIDQLFEWRKQAEDIAQLEAQRKELGQRIRQLRGGQNKTDLGDLSSSVTTVTKVTQEAALRVIQSNGGEINNNVIAAIQAAASAAANAALNLSSGNQSTTVSLRIATTVSHPEELNQLTQQHKQLTEELMRKYELYNKNSLKEARERFRKVTCGQRRRPHLRLPMVCFAPCTLHVYMSLSRSMLWATIHHLQYDAQLLNILFAVLDTLVLQHIQSFLDAYVRTTNTVQRASQRPQL
jgi:hypothetical protein